MGTHDFISYTQAKAEGQGLSHSPNSHFFPCLLLLPWHRRAGNRFCSGQFPVPFSVLCPVYPCCAETQLCSSGGPYTSRVSRTANTLTLSSGGLRFHCPSEQTCQFSHTLKEVAFDRHQEYTALCHLLISHQGFTASVLSPGNI